MALATDTIQKLAACLGTSAANDIANRCTGTISEACTVGSLSTTGALVAGTTLTATGGTSTLSTAVITTATITTAGVTTLNMAAAGDIKFPVQIASANGAITIKSGVVTITKGSAAAMTLADPTDVTDDGKVLHIRSQTAQAHTIDNSAGSGFNGGGASKDVATLGGAIGDGLSVYAASGKWWVLQSVNATLG